jgi:hypothetical protein
MLTSTSCAALSVKSAHGWKPLRTISGTQAQSVCYHYHWVLGIFVFLPTLTLLRLVEIMTGKTVTGAR